MMTLRLAPAKEHSHQTANGFFQAINPSADDLPISCIVPGYFGRANAFYGGSMGFAGFLLWLIYVDNRLRYRGKRKFAHTSVDGDD